MSNNHTAVIANVTNVRPHPNADRLKIANCLGNQIVVGLNTQENDKGVYFNCDLQLSEVYAKKNDLVRRKDEDGKLAGGMFDANRRVRAQKLRGASSDGFFASLQTLADATGQTLNYFESMEVGHSFDEIKGVPVCNKYVTPSTSDAKNNDDRLKSKDERVNTVMFHKHTDTAHFGRNTHLLKSDPNGMHVVVTSKMHGTSQRVGHVLTARKLTLVEKIASYFGADITTSEWTYLIGTRNVTLTPKKVQSLYHSAEFRDRAAKPFIGCLNKGETVYYEVVGYENGGKTIMNKVNIKKLKDKDFEKQYRRQDGSDEMIFSYGCLEGELAIYVYRITQTNEDGVSVDLSWSAVEQRCKEIGVKTVPVIRKTTVDESNFDSFLEWADSVADGPDVTDPSHVREGVCIRLEDGVTPTILKHKGFIFKVLEGIVKDTGVEDLEESS